MILDVIKLAKYTKKNYINKKDLNKNFEYSNVN